MASVSNGFISKVDLRSLAISKLGSSRPVLHKVFLKLCGYFSAFHLPEYLFLF